LVERTQYPGEFDTLWNAYPRRVSKFNAWRVVQRLLKVGITWPELIAAAENYAKSVVGKEQQFIKHASTFYGPGRHWEEFVHPVIEPENEEIDWDKLRERRLRKEDEDRKKLWGEQPSGV
jgi:hypothetical protein